MIKPHYKIFIKKIQYTPNIKSRKVDAQNSYKCFVTPCILILFLRYSKAVRKYKYFDFSYLTSVLVACATTQQFCEAKSCRVVAN